MKSHTIRYVLYACIGFPIGLYCATNARLVNEKERHDTQVVTRFNQIVDSLQTIPAYDSTFTYIIPGPNVSTYVQVVGHPNLTHERLLTESKKLLPEVRRINERNPPSTLETMLTLLYIPIGFLSFSVAARGIMGLGEKTAQELYLPPGYVPPTNYPAGLHFGPDREV